MTTGPASGKNDDDDDDDDEDGQRNRQPKGSLPQDLDENPTKVNFSMLLQCACD